MLRIQKKYYHMIIFPIVLVYCEILLRVFGDINIFNNLIYPVLFGIGTGLLFSVIASFFSEKNNRIISIVVLFGIGLIYIIECLIFDSFQFFMSPGAISSVSGDVADDYMQQVFRVIIGGIPVIILFFLPAILYVIFGKKYIPAKKASKRCSIILLAGAVVFTGIGVLTASTGSRANEYKSRYKFDSATQCFGLISSLQLDAYYGIFGNDAADTLVIIPDEDDSNDTLTSDKVEDAVITPDNSNQSENADIEEAVETEGLEDDAIIEEEPITEKVFEKNEMILPLDELSASTSDKTLISMNEYVKSLEASSQNEYTGLFEGKNLILICAEAFSHAAIDKELTPTLYRLAHNGFYFSDYYQPSWNGSTSTGEYSMLMGIAPLIDVRTMPATEGHNLYFTMGNQLQRLGYTGNAYHNGGYKYYSRNLTHENLGYDKYIAQGSGLEDLASPWPSDKEMFMGTVPTYIDQQPFSVYYMSVSGHFPYKKDDPKTAEYIEYVREKVGDRYKENTLYYLCYQMELEESLSYLVQQLEEKGIADDTVICITADHYPYGLEHSSTYGTSEDYIEDLYGYYPEYAWERDKNAWLLWSGCLENEYKDMVCEISEPTYSLDILPTLSNLFGLEYDSRLLVGRDVFSEESPLAIWVNHSWVSDLGKYDSSTDTFYPNEGQEIPDGYVDKMNTIVANKLSFSGKILDYDYYELLFPSEDS